MVMAGWAFAKEGGTEAIFLDRANTAPLFVDVGLQDVEREADSDGNLDTDEWSTTPVLTGDDEEIFLTRNGFSFMLSQIHCVQRLRLSVNYEHVVETTEFNRWKLPCCKHLLSTQRATTMEFHDRRRRSSDDNLLVS